MLRCRLLGHRYRFSAHATTMRWDCARGCGAAGHKRYPTATDAQRYATAFQREREQLDRRTPVSALPLRLARAARRHRPGP